MSKRSEALIPEKSGKKSPKKRSRITTDLIVPGVPEVLAEVRRNKKLVRDQLTAAEQAPAAAALEGVTEVDDLPSEEVSQKIEDLVVTIVSQIVTSGSFEMTIPNRSSGNQKYIEELDRIVLGDKVSKRQFLNTSHVRKAAITTRVVQLVHEVLAKGIHITKRDLFYTDVKLFKDQSESDAVLDDVACMVGW